jgi:hypothetical protein
MGLMKLMMKGWTWCIVSPIPQYLDGVKLDDKLIVVAPRYGTQQEYSILG